MPPVDIFLCDAFLIFVPSGFFPSASTLPTFKFYSSRVSILLAVDLKLNTAMMWIYGGKKQIFQLEFQVESSRTKRKHNFMLVRIYIFFLWKDFPHSEHLKILFQYCAMGQKGDFSIQVPLLFFYLCFITLFGTGSSHIKYIFS